MKLLIIGGTIFLGRALVESAVGRGHEVTLFNRGKHGSDLFPGTERITGDRDGGLDALEGRSWDAVIDTCGYFPRVVKESAELLKDSAGHYTFISSISAYAGFSQPNIVESSPLGTMEDETQEEVTGENYGPLKVLCEQATERAFPGRTLNIRPGLIVGPHDPSDRFTYWPVRVARGGEVLAPPSEDAIQIIDVRDLAEWNIRMIEQNRVGIYNAVGPDYRLTMRELLETCREISGSDAHFAWTSKEFLDANGVQGWVDLPCWMAEEGDDAGFSNVSYDKAVSDGLTFRPLVEIVRDTLAWASARPADAPLRAGLKPEREQELLALWHSSLRA